MSNALSNLCFSCLMDGGTEKEPITLEDAAETLEAWRAEDPEILEGLEDVTPEQFRQAWNETVEYLMGGSEK